MSERCSACDGTRRRSYWHEHSDPIYGSRYEYHSEPCAVCGGSGYEAPRPRRHECPRCGDWGYDMTRGGAYCDCEAGRERAAQAGEWAARDAAKVGIT